MQRSLLPLDRPGWRSIRLCRLNGEAAIGVTLAEKPLGPALSDMIEMQYLHHLMKLNQEISMDLNLLKLLPVLADEKSVTKARSPVYEPIGLQSCL